VQASAEGGVGRETFTIDRRLSEFEALHTKIQPLLPSLPAAFPVSKNLFPGEPVKRERVDKLQDYLRAAVSTAGPSPPPALLVFLGVEVLKIAEVTAPQRAAVYPGASHTLAALSALGGRPVRMPERRAQAERCGASLRSPTSWPSADRRHSSGMTIARA